MLKRYGSIYGDRTSTTKKYLFQNSGHWCVVLFTYNVTTIVILLLCKNKHLIHERNRPKGSKMTQKLTLAHFGFP